MTEKQINIDIFVKEDTTLKLTIENKIVRSR